MKPEIATRWIKALRSGKYKQGKQALKYKTAKGVTRHCCLGVLCELYNQDKKKQQKQTLTVKPAKPDQTVDLPKGSAAYIFGDTATLLPYKVMRWAGMTSSNGEINNKNEENLAEINDDGASFKQIAEIIENNADKL